jgi:signal transduction histidine kinase
MAGGREDREPGEVQTPGPRSVLGPCVLAVSVGTALVSLVALLNLEDLSPDALTRDAFALGAAALFLAAAVLRLARWRVTTDPHSGLLAAAMVSLCLITLPVGNLAGQVLRHDVQPSLALGARALGTAACLALAQRAMTVTDEGRPTDWARTLLVSAVTAVVGLAGLAGLVAVVPDRVSGPVLLGVVVEVALAGAWLAIGLAASVRDAVQPWAGRVAPLYASLGLVELLNALDQLRPGTWALPSSALLASVAMITAHSAYVDLLESNRLVSAVDHRTRQLSGGPHTAAVGPGTEQVTDFDVTEVVATVVRPRLEAGQEVRLRGGVGVAHARSGDLAAAVERLLANAATHAPRSPVTVHVVAIDGRIEISVTDRGPGMSAVDAARAVGGLHGARSLMARNGGGLELRNRIGGTTFVLVLPAAEDQRTEVIVPRWDSVGQSA